MSYRRTIDFLLHDWLDVESLRERPRFADHSRETFDSVLDTLKSLDRLTHRFGICSSRQAICQTCGHKRSHSSL